MLVILGVKGLIPYLGSRSKFSSLSGEGLRAKTQRDSGYRFREHIYIPRILRLRCLYCTEVDKTSQFSP